MNKVYLLLGSNIGDSEATLVYAEKNIEKSIGPIVKRSALYKTAAWGNTDQPDFLNRVIIVETPLTAAKLLQHILKTEEQMGRVRSFKNAPRTIDIDILFFNDESIQTDTLIVPHPEIQNRRFVLEPLAAIAPDLIHPVLRKKTAQLLAECRDELNVQKI